MAYRVLWVKGFKVLQAFRDLMEECLHPTSFDEWESVPTDSDQPDMPDQPDQRGEGVEPFTEARSPFQQHEDDGDTKTTPEREALKAVAQETRTYVASLLTQLHTTDLAKKSKKLSFTSCPRLNSEKCPKFPSPAEIKVINNDTLNIAVDLCKTAEMTDFSGTDRSQRPILINFANWRKPGGGWLEGRMAQEEEICYRSSLSLSLHKEDYPLQIDQAIYSPYVLVMRGDYASRHFLPQSTVRPEDLPAVSVITIAALDRPLYEDESSLCKAKRLSHHESGPPPPREETADRRFARDVDRIRTKQKMKLALRIAARGGHRKLVLGALGCGVYGNPPAEIAHCWLEALTEMEFKGNWWSDVRFAIYDPKNEGNFEIFHQILDGKRV